MDIVVLDDHVAQVHADAQPDLALDRPLRFALVQLALYVHRALHGLDDAGELGEDAVAHELHDAAPPFRDPRLHEFLAQGREPRQGARLVLSHETRVGDHVGG